MVARHDLVSDPAVLSDLAAARLGTAFFRRALNRVDDSELGVPTLLPGWTRAHLIAHVGYNARALARLVTWADTGDETPMYPSADARLEEIDLGATLPPEALRNLVEHAAIDLDVRWRDLPPERWSFPVRTAQGREVPAAETVWLRSREVWLHAVDLDAGCRFDQVPEPVLRRLLGDVHRTWAGRDAAATPTLVDTASGERWGTEETSIAQVEGPTSALAAWATGRSPVEQAARTLVWSTGTAAPAPRWI